MHARGQSGSQRVARSAFVWIWMWIWIALSDCITLRKALAFTVPVVSHDKLSTIATTATTAATQWSLNAVSPDHNCVVVGKIIIDEYQRDPVKGEPATQEASLTIGGGGPQAAWGAAAALAVLADDSSETETVGNVSSDAFPPSQPVTFVAPVGEWSSAEQQAMEKAFGNAISTQRIHLIKNHTMRTPRIALWHGQNQAIQWKPLNGSWGIEGADSLWRDRPSAQDLLSILKGGQRQSQNKRDKLADSLFVIMEGGVNGPGGGMDSLFLSNSTLTDQISFVGVEPVVFPDDTTGQVRDDDAESCRTRIDQYESVVDFISPDQYLFEAIDKPSQDHPTNFWNRYAIAIRNGPDGSIVSESTTESNNRIRIPAAKLCTKDGEPVNPTGAGNAYASAVTACLGAGATICEAACIASAIGAVVCEYEHLPPWTWTTLDRIKQARLEISKRMDTASAVAVES